ncbi:energy-coupling factor ABC transporter ATP-binding protein [Thermococcus sp.]
MKVIEVRNISFRYRNTEEYALKNVSFSVEKGELVGIIGPSGSGKSTLCLTLNGIIPQSITGRFSGEILITNPQTGENMNTVLTPVPKLSTVVGLVLQNPESQLFNMTVEDEVAFALENLGLPRDEIEKRIGWALRIVGLEDKKEEFPPNLSGGEKQRLAIACVLAMKTPILVLDEPTSELDPKGKKDVLGIIKKLKGKGFTILMSEHDSNFLFKNADKILVMNGGSVVFQGTPKEISDKIDELIELGVRVPKSLLVSKKLGLPPAFTPSELLSLLKARRD